MQPFRHQQRLAIGKLIEQSNRVLEHFISEKFGLQPMLSAFLEAVADSYRETGQEDRANGVLVLQAELASAGRGLDPKTLQPISVRRNAVVRATCLRIIQESATTLRDDAAALDADIAALRASLLPLTLAAAQRGLIDLAGPQPDQAALPAIWTRMVGNPEIGLAARQAQMQASPYDIYLLLDELIAAARD